MRVGLSIIVLSLFVSGCVTESATDRSRSVASEANVAEKRGDWMTSAQLWEQAINIEKGIWDDPEFSNSPKLIAIYYYELGRSLGVLGKYDDAGRNLLEALRLDEKFNGPKGMDLVELARLNHARGDNARAASYLDKVVSRIDEISEHAPAQYFALLTESAAIYEAVGQSNQAAMLKIKAEKFSESHPDLKSLDDYDWTPYKISASK
jgi:Tfp pilus assembly protein PilF